MVGRALRRAGRVARKTARMHGTPIYLWRDGKVVAEKPWRPDEFFPQLMAAHTRHMAVSFTSASQMFFSFSGLRI
jgi:hypothetical protein